MRVDPCKVAWIFSYLTCRPQYDRLKDTMSCDSDCDQQHWSTPGHGAGFSFLHLVSLRLLLQLWATSRSSQTTQPSLDASGMTERSSIGVWWGTFQSKPTLTIYSSTRQKEQVIDFGKPRSFLSNGAEAVDCCKYFGLWLQSPEPDNIHRPFVQKRSKQAVLLEESVAF